MHTLITAPAYEPLTVEIVKLHCRIDGDARDALVTTWIQAAREYAETFTGRQLVGATWEQTLNFFPGGRMIPLPRAPLRSVTSVKYTDENGTEQTLSSSAYSVWAPAGPRAQPGGLTLAYDETWPTTRVVEGAVRVRYLAGYTAADVANAAAAMVLVPAAIRQAMLLLCAELSERPAAAIQGTIIGTVPFGVDELLWPYRIEAA